MSMVTDAIVAPGTRLRSWGSGEWKALDSPLRRAAVAAGVWAATRVAGYLVGYVALVFYGQHGAPDVSDPIMTPHQYLAHWLQQDTPWYLAIAQTGYPDPNRTAFFPLYPFLVRVTTFLVGPHWLAAGLLVSLMASLAFYVGLAELAHDQGVSSRLMLLLASAVPVAFFLTAAYTEATFLAFAVWALVAMRRGWWYRAALFTFLATLTRSTGVVLVLPLWYEYARQHHWLQSVGFTGRRIGEIAACLLAAPAAIGIFAFTCWLSIGNALSSLAVQHTYWGRTSMPIWQSLAGVYQRLAAAPSYSYWQARLLLDLLSLAIVVAVTLVTWRQLPLSFSLYTVGIAVLTVAEPAVLPGNVIWYDSAARFMLAAVPIALVLARWSERWPGLESFLLAAGFMLQAVFLTAFLTGGWIV